MAQTRRRFLKVIGGAIAASTLFDVDKLLAGPTFIRKDVGGLTAGSSDLVSYGNAINAMKALPSTNPLSWAYQAAIHGTTLPGAHPAWNTCEHGTLEFLSWHRMYLYWFERIIRKKSGDPNFALPFWNYESSSERYLPPPFRTPGTGLYVPDANRGTGWNSGTSSLPGTAVSTSGCLPQVPFTSFSNNLEGTPHAAVHNTFGSTGGWMGSIDTAAQDPIFFLHHCNIDRIWNAWLAQGGGRTNPLGDTTWKTKKFLFFNEDGKEVWMTGCDILRAQEQLGYVYQNEPPQVKEYCLKLPPWWWKYLYEVVIQWPPIKLPPGPDPGPIEIDIRQFRERLQKIAEDKNVGLVLQLNDVTADRQPNVFWEVYAGLGKGDRAVPESRNYIGNLALFGGGVHAGEGHGSARAADFELPLNAAIRTALANGETALSVRFVARGAASKEPRQYRNNAAVTIGKVAIAVRRPEQAKI
ncbi:MAG TPA: tyrosinase family protein [Thermoanaerobaculia bacterium]|jgi:tyrosinase|nr:tyrosinase family protein [Thermoanaerobaculia bacterium]